MKLEFRYRTMAAGLVLSALAVLALPLQAGEMEPWAPPSGTMKPLSDIEPRRIILGEHLSSEGYLRITESGSYYLGETIDATGKWGIEIAASNVTLDLNGFTLANGFGVGIRTDPASVSAGRVVIQNGTVSGWGSHGIEIDPTWGDVLVTHVYARANGGIGIRVVYGHVIDCSAVVNDADGIAVIGGGVVRGCIAINNGNNGIQVGHSARVSDCLVSGNDGNGIRLESRSLAEGNVVHFSHEAGIRALSGWNRIDSNQLHGNQYGIQLVDNGEYDNVVIRNSVSSSGIVDYDVGTGNDVGPIGTAGTSTSPWANFVD